jgi:hypothetical protein
MNHITMRRGFLRKLGMYAHSQELKRTRDGIEIFGAALGPTIGLERVTSDCIIDLWLYAAIRWKLPLDVCMHATDSRRFFANAEIGEL